MLPILTPAESAEIDRQSVRRGIRVEDLMENAGREVARRAARVMEGTYGRRAVVVCGKGNNGGDGLVAARYLERWGTAATVVLLSDDAGYRGDAGLNLRRFAATGARVKPFSRELLERELGRADVAVDAVFGTGFRGEPEGDFRQAIRGLNQAALPVVAVDIPSGVDGETGAVQGEAVLAAVTVALGALKPGVVFDPGARHAGRVSVADIGLPPDLVRSDLWLAERDDMVTMLPRRPPDAHKRSTGVVLVIAASRLMTGGAALAAESAYRAGAGLVQLAVPKSLVPVVAGLVREPTFVALPETAEGSPSEDAWPVLEERFASIDATAVGPALGRHPSTVKLVRRIVAESPVPMVLDADGLNAFADAGSLLAERRSQLIVTPHSGELGRLVGLESREIVSDRVGHARKAAADFRCAVLLKGPATVVAEPGGRAVVNPTGGPYLATGGTGDVLTGAIAAFLARGLDPARAGILGAYVQGYAGSLAASKLGEGTLASDVLASLPTAMESLVHQP